MILLSNSYPNLLCCFAIMLFVVFIFGWRFKKNRFKVIIFLLQCWCLLVTYLIKMFFFNVTSNPWLEELKGWLGGDIIIALLKEVQHHLSLSIFLLMCDSIVGRFANDEATLWSSWASFGKSIKKSNVKEEWKMLSQSIC